MISLHANIAADTDAYKLTHWLGSPPKLSYVHSYGEHRKGAHFDVTCEFGRTFILRDLLAGSVVTQEKIEEAAELVPQWMGYPDYFNRPMWEHILNNHDGKLPLEIWGVPEGTVVPVGNVNFHVHNTGGSLTAPLTNHVESILMHQWSTSVVATNSLAIYHDIRPLVKKSGTMALLPYMVVDFGFRGVDNHVSALRKGSAHMISFNSSDNLIADRALRHYYSSPGVLQSVWATEHFVGTSFGPGSGEIEYVLHQLREAPDDAIVSIVIDSYDPINFIRNVVGDPVVMAAIKARSGRTVFRPDSGNPIHQTGILLDMLGGLFHYEYNDKHFKVLKHNVGLLWGDGMDRNSIYHLYYSIVDNGWSTDNLVVGSGGGLLVKGFTRDTQRDAIKASEVKIDGQLRAIQKQVLSDPTKSSKPGRLKLHKTGNSYMTLSKTDTPNWGAYTNELIPVFKDGEMFNTPTFDEVRQRAMSYDGEAFRAKGPSAEVRA